MKDKKRNLTDPDDTSTGHFSEHISIDRMGSYTGITETPWEEPVQDADDL